MELRLPKTQGQNFLSPFPCLKKFLKNIRESITFYKVTTLEVEAGCNWITSQSLKKQTLIRAMYLLTVLGTESRAPSAAGSNH